MKKKNGWPAKMKRTVTSSLPISKNRRGKCVRCGACCKLPTACPFLKIEADGKASCSIYKMRYLNCRKYPRTKSEFVTEKTCGYRFGKNTA